MTDFNTESNAAPPVRVGRFRSFVRSEWFVPVLCAFVVPFLSVTGVIIYVVFFIRP